ncbi:helix-turn-helix domain-containing protein [Aquimarina mytili]|uniref:Helix-turn-helix domain-containing protein n=1 Tax=Aquimarina mytili TaxID=874423 RepID=A0A936ZUN3_9FLAO|nr:helix-turn-helix domain-containing protein [Aquimarina mytili]MBL0682223.1 helix-turn-helix domain-containing protein [Aquimarina mytili]
MNKISFYFIITILINNCYVSIAQNSHVNTPGDSLKLKTYEVLKNKFYENQSNSNLARLYAKTYLEKAKRDTDTIKIADGFYFFGLIDEYAIAHQYTDSIIDITKHLVHEKYPGFAYKLKGNLFFMEGNYREAFNQYVIASEFAKKRRDKLEYAILKFNIGLLKNQLGERVEALDFFKDYMNYISEKELVEKRRDLYIKGIYALSESYTYNLKLDSAEKYIKKGVVETLKTKDTLMYNLFVLQSGINYFFQDKYQIAIDSLEKAEKRIRSFAGDDKIGLAICNYYIGKSFFIQNNTDQGVYYLKRTDTLLNEANTITPELIDTYNVLIAHYKNEKDDKNQLKYINSLLKFDSILKYNYKSLSNKIIRNYESKELLDQKNQLIDKLEENTFFSKKLITVFIAVILILVTIVFFVIRKNWIYKKRFQHIIDQTKNNIEESKEENLKIATKNTNLPEELVKEVLERLERFEQSKKFLKGKYTLNSLAKELNTNSSYLSKIINETKKINFANYLNDLKIKEAIDRLTNEKKFRAYTIKTIANEVGFNTAQSFSLAFYKKTGIYPSYFIKQIENQKK